MQEKESKQYSKAPDSRKKRDSFINGHKAF